MSPETAKAYKIADAQTRKAFIDMEKRMEIEHFQRWVLERAEKIASTAEQKGYLEEMAEKYFEDSGMSRHTPFPKNMPKQSMSYNDMREYQWDKEVEIEYTGMDWMISKKEIT